MGGRTLHLSLSVRGALNWNKTMLKKLLKDENGKYATAEEAKEFLLDKLSKGFELIPLGDECNNFDKKKGCLGHREEKI